VPVHWSLPPGETKKVPGAGAMGAAGAVAQLVHEQRLADDVGHRHAAVE